MPASFRNAAARRRLYGLAAGLAGLTLPATVLAGPFTITHESVSQSTETYIVITGPVFDVYSVTWTDAKGVSHTSSVTSGSALFKPHVKIDAKKGTTVTVKNVSELAVPPTTFVASLFTPPSDVVNTALAIQPGSFATVAGNTFTLGGSFTTVTTTVDYDPASPGYGQLGGSIPASSFDLHGTSPAGNMQLALTGDLPWNINLASIWGPGVEVPAGGLGVSFNQALQGTLSFNSTLLPVSGNFVGTVTFFAGNTETICGQLQFESITGNVCASGQSFASAVPEPGIAVLMLGGLGVLGAAGQRRKRRPTHGELNGRLSRASPPDGAHKKTPGRPKFSCAPAGGRDGQRPALGGALNRP